MPLKVDKLTASEIVLNGTELKPSYKVYTALLTQSGGDNISYTENFSNGGTQNIVKGVSYKIDVNPENVDFSSIGALSNAEGTYFVATENKVNTDFPDLTWALEYNTGAPVVTVLENTIGNIWFTYNVSGEYNANSSNLFTQNKTVVLLGTLTNNSYDKTFVTNTSLSDSLCTIAVQDGAYISQDGELNNTPIEIRVYN